MMPTFVVMENEWHTLFRDGPIRCGCASHCDARAPPRVNIATSTRSALDQTYFSPHSPMDEFSIRDRESRRTGIHLPKDKVIIKHPCYPDEFGQNDLLTLYAWDTESGGIHIRMTCLALSLIACNSFNGYLTKDRSGMQRVNCDGDRLLPPGQYYFHVPSPTDQPLPYKYPVYPNFQNWSFPHQTIPQDWKTGSDDTTDEISLSDFASARSVSAISSAVIARDKSCIVSGSRDFLHRAHLCPRAETEWFQTNGMSRYNNQLELSGDVATDDMANAIALRPDIHTAFDQGYFMIARKKEHWVLHFLRTTHDLGRDYHRLPVDINPNVAPEFLMVRFAWAVFPLVRSFLERGGERLIKVRQHMDAGFQEVEKVVGKDDVSTLFAKALSRARSASPKKRKPVTIPEENDSVKRPCHESIASFISFCPELSQGGNSGDDLSDTYEVSVSDDERLKMMKKSVLRHQRPTDLSLICCDYSKAEFANALGIEGIPEYGGGHLCERCLGMETRDDLE